MKVSKKAESITPSLTRRLFNMAHKLGGDVIDLTLGDPDILPPLEIREAACEAIISGEIRYSANAGLLELRKKYATFFNQKYGRIIDPSTDVIVTVGGMEALFLSLSAIVDQGDEIIILAPYYVNYLQMINMMGGKAIVVDIFNKTDDEIMDAINKSTTERTVAIMLNSPCNPTGEIMSSRLLDGIAAYANEKDLYVISDEVYSSLVYDSCCFESIMTRPGMEERAILIDSCSKRFAMTGWRVGFAVGNETIISNMVKMQENVAACAPLPSQYAAIKAYSKEVKYDYIKNTYEKRRDLVYRAVSQIPNLDCKKPQATFYCFVNISKTGLDSESFAYELLEKAHVAVVPGVAYGENYSDYIRIAFTLNEDKLNEAMKRIKRFCEEI